MLLLLLLSLGRVGSSSQEEITFVDFEGFDAAEEAVEEPAPEPEQRAESEPRAVERVPPRPVETDIVTVPLPAEATPVPVVTPPNASVVRQPHPRYGVGPRPIQNPLPPGLPSGLPTVAAHKAIPRELARRRTASRCMRPRGIASPTTTSCAA